MGLRQVSLLALVALTAGAFVWGFAQLPLDQASDAVDWKVFHQATSGFRIDYPGNRVYNPPWTLATLWPFTVWPLAISRGLAALLTLIVFAISVPKRKNMLVWAASVVLLVFSYPMIRHLVDGNLEAMIVGGVLLALYATEKRSPIALAGALVLMSSKLQETWLLLAILAAYVWRRWPRREILTAGAMSASFILPFAVWKGAEWIQALRVFPYARTAIDSSLIFVLESIGISTFIAWCVWVGCFIVTVWVALKRDLNRQNAGLLITAGLMLSSYAAGNSLVTPLALAVIPLFQKRWQTWTMLIVLFYVPYFFLSQIELRLAWENIYWGGVLFITWLLLIWEQLALIRSKAAVQGVQVDA